MFIIYRPKPTNTRPRKTLSLDVDSYHRPSPTISTFGDEIVSTKRKTINDYTFTYQFDAHVWAYISLLLSHF